MGRKFECGKDIHYKTQTGTSCEKCNSKAFRLGIEPASSGLPDQCSTTELQKPLPELSLFFLIFLFLVHHYIFIVVSIVWTYPSLPVITN